MKIFTVSVDYSMSYRQAVEACAFSEVVGEGPGINHPDRCRLPEKGKVDLKMGILETKKRFWLDKVKTRAYRKKVRFATILECLAFGVKHPEEYRSLPLLGLGDVCDAGEFLDGAMSLAGGGKRALFVGRCGSELPPARILVVVE